MEKVNFKLCDPEKEVESEVLRWAFQNRWSLDVYDSKGTYSKAKGRYSQNTGMKTGTPDLLGVTAEGFAAFLELKAPGKEKVCRIEQHSFLTRKIDSNAFALVLSSVSFLEETYSAWLKLRNQGKEKEARQFLLSLLPKKVLVNKKVFQLPE